MDNSELLRVEIPNFITHITLSKSRRPKYRIDDTGQMILTNKRTVGKPRLWKINGQALVTGMDHHLRSKVFIEMKDYLRNHLQSFEPITKYPICIEAELYEYPHAWNWDVSNKSLIWYKNFEDALQQVGIIPNDNIKFIRKTGGMEYFPVFNEEDRKLVFKITKSEYDKGIEIPETKDDTSADDIADSDCNDGTSSEQDHYID